MCPLTACRELNNRPHTSQGKDPKANISAVALSIRAGVVGTGQLRSHVRRGGSGWGEELKSAARSFLRASASSSVSSSYDFNRRCGGRVGEVVLETGGIAAGVLSLDVTLASLAHRSTLTLVKSKQAMSKTRDGYSVKRSVRSACLNSRMPISHSLCCLLCNRLLLLLLSRVHRLRRPARCSWDRRGLCAHRTIDRGCRL